MKWIIVASSVIAKIYSVSAHEGHHHLTLIKALEHPAGLKHNRDLVSDRPGHYQANHAHGSFEETDAKEVEQDRFAQQITHDLEHARNEHQFTSFTLVAAPHFLGLLEKHFKKPLKDCMGHMIEKNIVNLSDHELEQFLHNELYRL